MLCRSVVPNAQRTQQLLHARVLLGELLNGCSLPLVFPPGLLHIASHLSTLRLVLLVQYGNHLDTLFVQALERGACSGATWRASCYIP